MKVGRVVRAAGRPFSRHLRLRRSTVVLLIVFVGLGVLYLYLHPATSVPGITSSSSTTSTTAAAKR